MADEDAEFYKTFKDRLALINLPCPETLYGSLQTALANVSLMAGGIAKLGNKATMGEIFRAYPRLSGGASAEAVAGGVLERSLAVSGMLAALYVGIVVGALIGVAVEIYGFKVAGQIAKWVRELGTKVGPVDILLEKAAKVRPGYDFMHTSVELARAYGGGSVRRGRGYA